jgi:hypothetical protein
MGQINPLMVGISTATNNPVILSEAKDLCVLSGAINPEGFRFSQDDHLPRWQLDAVCISAVNPTFR